MGAKKKPLRRSVTIGSAAFVVLLGVVLTVMTYFSFRQALYQRFEAQMTDTLNYIDRNIDHDDLAQAVRTLQPSPHYPEVQALLDDVYVNYSFHYVYILASTDTEDGPGVLDVCTGLSPEDYAAGEGELYRLGADMTEDYNKYVRQKFRQIAQEGKLTFFTEKWEGMLDYTGALPLRDSSGEVYAILCLDLSTDEISAVLLTHTALHLLLIAAMGFLFNRYFLRWITKNVVKPVEALERSVSAFARVSHEQQDPTLLEYNPPAIQTGNEVESLSNSITQMSADLKEYAVNMMRAESEVVSMQTQMDRIGEIAYRDSLTRVKNKAAFMKTKNMLNRTILTMSARFGIVMIDLNSLKKMNDTYGHKRGDSYIVACAQLISSVFAYSPVFRIGGDEFLVVLEGRDYDNRDNLVNRLSERFRVLSKDESLPPWERLSAAIGAAVYTENDHTVDAVFKRADDRMYANKKAMKGGRDA